MGELLIGRTDCVKVLGVALDRKLHFRRHVNYFRSQGLKLLGRICLITCNFSSTDSQQVLYITLVL
jgi:hypothetical protein